MSLDPQGDCYVHAIGTAVPERCLEPDEAVRVLSEGCPSRRSLKLLERIIRLTGVQRRYLAALDFQDLGAESLYRPSADQPLGPGMAARTEMFQQAAGPLVGRALEVFAPEELAQVEALITVSCTHASSPGLEKPVFDRTSVPASVGRWNLGFMGCSAALAGIRLVHGMAQRRRTALVLACELSSLHFQYTDELDQMTANLLFADGAAAVLLSPRASPVRVIGCRSFALPDAAEQMIWYAGNHGLQLRLAQELPQTLAAHLPAAVKAFLEECETSPQAVGHWLVHPGGPQILDSVEKCLYLRPDALRISRDVLRSYGNMSSPTILFILKAFLETRPRGQVVAMAFGPGLTIEMVLLHVDETRA